MHRWITTKTPPETTTKAIIPRARLTPTGIARSPSGTPTAMGMAMAAANPFFLGWNKNNKKFAQLKM